MKKQEIKSIGVKSMFKATIYFMIAPIIFMMIIGLFIILVANGDSALIFLGITYLVIMPILAFVLYGPIAMLTTWIYNKMAGRFGGLEIYVVDDEEL